MVSALLMLAGCYLVHAPGADVAITQHLGVTGLWRDPNPHSEAPDGALDRAEEVVFRRKGTAEPRPGFDLGATFASLDELWGIIPYDGTYLVAGDAPMETATAYWASGTGVNDVGGGALEWNRDAIRGQESRKNLYVTTTDALRKVTSGSDTTADLVGLPRPDVFYKANNAGTVVPVDYYVAYRLVLRRVDANDVVTRSAPSARVIVQNVEASLQDFTLRVGLQAADDYQAGDTIEMYRTRTSSVTPSDEMFLAKEHEITSAEITAETFDIEDDTVDDDLGAALYTNSSRDGIERENTRPPLATDLALYAGSLFASRVTYPHRLLVRFDEGGDATGSDTAIGRRNYDGIRTNGSAVISALTGTTGLKIGQILTAAASWNGTGPVRITAVDTGAATVTMSETWGGATDGAPTSLFFDDTIRISNGTEDQYYRAGVAWALTRHILAGDAAASRTAASTAFTAYAIGNALQAPSSGTAADGNRRRVAIETILPSGAAFEVWATHGSLYEPPLPEPTEADGEASVQDVFPNGVVWSKQDEPEHFTRSPSARRLVGKENVPILRILRAGERLWILKGKGDGIYKLSGFGERSGFRVDQADADTYLLHPNLATVLGDSVYAWTNKGAVKIDDGGITALSAPVIGSEFGIMELNLDHDVADCGTFAVANEKDGEIIWGLPGEELDPSNAQTYAERVYVLNTENRAWSQWLVGADLFASAAYNPETRLLLLGEIENVRTRVERASDELRGDIDYSVTIASVSGDTVTINAGSGWTPAVGDLITRLGEIGIVTDVTSATVFDVHDATGLSAGAGTAYEHFDALLKWLTKTGKEPSMLKRFTQVVTHWEDTFGIYGWALAFAPLGFGSTSLAGYTRTYAREEDSADDHLAHVPRNAALGSRFAITLAISQAGSQFRVAGLTLSMEPAGRRLNR